MAGSGRVGVRAVNGGFALFVGRLAHSTVSAVGSIVIARLLGPANYGVVSIALIYPLMFSELSDLGLSTAIMRYASIGDFRRAFAALQLRVLITTAFAVALIPLAPYLAFTLHRPYLTPMIDVLAIYAFAYKLAMMYTFVRLTKVMNLIINLARNNFVKIFELLDTITTLYIWTSLLSILLVNSITVYELNIRDLKLYK
jgi:O-antigen/teichoic acid export membrane protein